MNTNVSFVCRNNTGITERSDGLCESAAWHVTADRAAAVVGGTISFHEHKSENSYRAGRVVGFFVRESDQRIVFVFKPHLNVVEGGAGLPWSQEKAFW